MMMAFAQRSMQARGRNLRKREKERERHRERGMIVSGGDESVVDSGGFVGWEKKKKKSTRTRLELGPVSKDLVESLPLLTVLQRETLSHPLELIHRQILEVGRKLRVQLLRDEDVPHESADVGRHVPHLERQDKTSPRVVGGVSLVAQTNEKKKSRGGGNV